MTKPARLRLAAMILLSPLWTACAPPRVEIVKPPLTLTTCADEPIPPELPGRDQLDARDRLVLEYILSLRSAGADCRAKVIGVKAWSDNL